MQALQVEFVIRKYYMYFQMHISPLANAITTVVIDNHLQSIPLNPFLVNLPTRLSKSGNNHVTAWLQPCDNLVSRLTSGGLRVELTVC